MKTIFAMFMASALSVSAFANNPCPVINIRTENVSMIIRAEKDGRLATLHFGSAIDDVSIFTA